MKNIKAQPDRLMLLQWLINTQKDWVWQRLAELREKEMDITESIMTSEELRNELLEGIKDSEEGRSISVEDLKKESQNW
jgi:hypothetical protein